jgi:hypothetical protein
VVMIALIASLILVGVGVAAASVLLATRPHD